MIIALKPSQSHDGSILLCVWKGEGGLKGGGGRPWHAMIAGNLRACLNAFKFAF